MNEWDEKPHFAASKLGLDTKEQWHVPLCPSGVEEEKKVHLWSPVLGDFT